MFKVISPLSRFFLMLGLSMFLTQAAIAQDMSFPQPSPSASVMQVVGMTKISVDYSSPGVKGRKIWGELVPFGEVWRTGANAATKVTFSTDVKVNGNDLAAGSYSLTTLPGEAEWGVMFKLQDSEGDEPTLKVMAKPQTGAFLERMAFLIENNTNSSADLVLQWEKLRLVLNIAVDTDNLVMAAAGKEISGSWQLPFNAAQYCLANDSNLEKGLEYANLSTAINQVYWNMRVKAQLEAKLGKKKEAIKTMTAAIELGSAMEQAPFDFDGMKKMLAEWKG